MRIVERARTVDEGILHPVFQKTGIHVYVTRTGAWRIVRPVKTKKPAPCTAACPAGVHIREIMGLVKNRNFDAAWAVLKEENPLPAVSGRVCYHPCEEGCNRRQFDEGLSIHSIERFLGDYGLGKSVPGITPNGRRAAVIGSGPAGLSAAYHLARKGFGVTVFESSPQAGGMLRYGIPAYRLPREILEREIADIQALGVEIRTGIVFGRDVKGEALRDYHAVFVATGCPISIEAELGGKAREGVCNGLDALARVNTSPEKARLYFSGKRVAVIGGGNVALDAARSALRLNSREVTVLYRRSPTEMPATGEEILEAEAEGVKFQYLVAPLKALQESGRITGLQCVRMQLGAADRSGRPAPMPIPGSEFELPTDILVAAVGQVADHSYLPGGLVIPPRGPGVHRLGKIGETVVFAGGDFVSGPARVVDALAAGKDGAKAIQSALDPKGEEQKGEIQGIGFDRLNPVFFHRAERRAEEKIGPEARAGNFNEIHLPPGESDAVAEAGRCFSCGECDGCGNCWLFCPDMSVVPEAEGYQIDYEYCKGCGICAEECPRGCLDVVEEEV